MTYGTPFEPHDRKIVRQAMAKDLLTKEREQYLAHRWQTAGDVVALEELTSAYLRLAISYAKKFRHYGLPQSDLIQEGVVGLMEAAKRFDVNRDVRFSTYSSWWVRATIQDYVLRNWSIVRTGTTAAHKSLFFKLRRLKARLGLHSDAPLSLEDREKIASEIGVATRDVELMDGRLSRVDGSLNVPVADDSGREWQDLLVSEAPQPDQVIEHKVDSEKVSKLLSDAMAMLNDRETFIIRERRLKEDGDTLASLGEKLGVSKERVRQLEGQALQKLKKALSSTCADLPYEEVMIGA